MRHKYPSKQKTNSEKLGIAQGECIHQGQDILITGITRVGQSYLVAALGYLACNCGCRVKYYITSRLLAKLKMVKSVGTYLKKIEKIVRQQLIILDDFGLQAMDNQNRMAFFEIIEERHGKVMLILHLSCL